MRYRTLGKTGLRPSVIGIGTWQFGGEWGVNFTQTQVDAILDAAAAWRVSHHSDIHQKLKQAHEMMGLINEKFAGMEQTFQAMSLVQLNRERLGEYLAAVYPDSTEPDKQLLVQRDRSWSEFFFDQGRGNRQVGVEGTLWAGFNGVTEWIDHRKTRQNSNQRLNSSWFGDSARIKFRAFSVAVDKMAVWN